MRLLVGLGNPGSKYEKNRHNVGFMAVDEIHRHGDFSAWKARFNGLTSEGRLGTEKVLLLKPTTFMNESGRAVGEAARFYRIEPADVVVLYDELDLPPGKVRIKTGGGAGGHNGIRSIDAHLGKEYRRVRIGIGHPGHKDRVQGHVLGDFGKADAVWLEPLLDEIGRSAAMLADGNDSSFMNRVALAVNGDEPISAKGANKPKGQSHIRQARPKKQSKDVKPSGPMADMLKKLLGGD